MDDHYAFLKELETIAASGGFDDMDSLFARLSREMAIGTKGKIFSDLLYGYNRNQQGSAVPGNSDIQGMAFFTRPNLNLSYDNLAMERTLTPLMSRELYTYQRAVRCMLDPIGSRIREPAGKGLIDNRQAFLPLLSNSLVSMSGWPDLVANAYSSPEGMAKETWMMNDSIVKVNGRFDLNCSFQNMLGDPITLLFQAWLTYMGAVYLGTMSPYIISLIENEIDYMTRVYRFVLDYSGRFIQKWACCGVAMPTSLNIGSSFDMDRANPFSTSVDQVSMSFACIGAEYNDPVILDDFNKTVITQNARMADGARQEDYVKIPRDERNLFNYNGYPRVNLKNNELEWWIDKDIYAAYKKGDI